MPRDYVLKNLIFVPYRPLKGDPQGMTRHHNQNPVQYDIRLSLLSICANFGIKIFRIDFVIDFYCYLTFWPLPRAPGGRAKNKVLLHTPLM